MATLFRYAAVLIAVFAGPSHAQTPGTLQRDLSGFWGSYVICEQERGWVVFHEVARTSRGFQSTYSWFGPNTGGARVAISQTPSGFVFDTETEGLTDFDYRLTDGALAGRGLGERAFCTSRLWRIDASEYVPPIIE
ncbi:MAG: hypothetical protein AAF914_00995 [Pseudomonadota bacterium]